MHCIDAYNSLAISTETSCNSKKNELTWISMKILLPNHEAILVPFRSHHYNTFSYICT